MKPTKCHPVLPSMKGSKSRATLAIIDGSGGGISVGRDVEEGREGGRRGQAHFWVEVNGGTQSRLLPSNPGYPPSPLPVVASDQHFIGFIIGYRS
ncbi:hypothetical protein VitviT2T_028031 [Vitis vinifera]|uniref:Uncharacterized protein n=1 Tax=Vitis vinifera TaxID=29760 RepID=A0ABY9DST1_VITVI|nr:hypothetical protein VitviT2T_028031 [Vitis vinifera]